MLAHWGAPGGTHTGAVDVKLWGRNRRSSRGSWAARLRDLQVPEGCSTECLIAAVSVWRGRKLIVVDDPEIAVACGPCGLWMSSDTHDAIWVDPTAVGLHREKIISHELGHMINGDEPYSLDPDLLIEIIMGGAPLSPEVVQGALARTSYEMPQEARAEGFSTWFTALAERRRHETKDPLLDNIRASLDTMDEYW